MKKRIKAGFFPAGLVLVLKRARQTLTEFHDPVAAASILDMAVSRVRQWDIKAGGKGDLRRILEKAHEEVTIGSPVKGEFYIDKALDQLQPKTKDAKTDTKNTAAATAGRGQGRQGQGAKEGADIEAGTGGGAGAVAGAPFRFKPNKRSQTDGGLRPVSNGANADTGEEMVSLVPDAAELDNETKLTDALTNLLHWCDRERVVFDVALKMSRIHHQAER